MIQNVPGLLVCAAALWAAPLADAQVDNTAINPAALNERAITTLEHYRTQEELRDADGDAPASTVVIDPPSAADGATLEDAGPLIMVRRIETNASALLNEADIRGVLRPYENRELSMAQLNEAAAAVQRLYALRGRFAARAFLPAQDVTDGVVRLALVEARLDDVVVAENASTRADYVRKFVRSQPGELVSVAELEQDLRRFNTLHDANVRAALAPGSTFGTTNYALTLDEPARWQPMAFVDNAGREDVGLERIGLSFAVASVLGFRDRLALAVNFSEDLDQGTKGGSLSYDFPLNARGTRATVTYDRSNVVVVSGPVAALNVRGTAWNAAVNLRHPFVLNPRFRLDAFAGYADKFSSTDFDDVELFRVETRTLSLGVDLQWRHAAGATVMRHQITSDTSAVGGDGNFTRYNAELTSTRRFANGIVATARARLQLGSAALMPATEQFQLGGIASVRGYDEGLLIGDDGYFTSIEASMPLSDSGSRNRAFVFLDHGAAYAFKGNDEGRNRDDILTSLGAGVSFSLSRFFSGRLTLGFPLRSREDIDGRDDPRLHFFVQSARF